MRELGRVGQGDRADWWHTIVSGGLCTMMPEIGQWLRRMAGLNEENMYLRLGLKDTAKILLPNGFELSKGNHDAGNDAQMHWHVCRELKRYVQQAPVETQ